MFYEIYIIESSHNTENRKGKYKKHNNNKCPADKVGIIPGCYGFSKKWVRV